MRLPPYLYHGTSASHVDGIARNGLIPGVNSGFANYSELGRPRSPYVYFAHALAIPYAVQTAMPTMDLAVVRVKTSRFEHSLLRADEDYFIEQILPLEIEEPPTDRGEASAIALRRIEEEPERAEESLRSFGSIAYRNAVPASDIAAIAIYQAHPDDVFIRLLNEFQMAAQNVPYHTVVRQGQAFLDRLFRRSNVAVQELMTTDSLRTTRAMEVRRMQDELTAMVTSVLAPA